MSCENIAGMNACPCCNKRETITEEPICGSHGWVLLYECEACEFSWVVPWVMQPA